MPEARVAVGHGQMSEDELERVMVDFVAHKYDVLLATTIIENGPRHPERKHDHHQSIRSLRALAALSAARPRRAIGPARVRLPADSAGGFAVAGCEEAARRDTEFSDLGSGFRVAALDLEIRGAGNLLGGEQSGHIEAVGFDMYMKLLEQTINELKGEELEDEIRANVNLRGRPAHRRDATSPT